MGEVAGIEPRTTREGGEDRGAARGIRLAGHVRELGPDLSAVLIEPRRGRGEDPQVGVVHRCGERIPLRQRVIRGRQDEVDDPLSVCRGQPQRRAHLSCDLRRGGLVVAAHRVIDRVMEPRDEGPERAVGRLADKAVEGGDHLVHVDCCVIAAVGLGIPAPIDTVSGQVGSAGLMPGWQGVHIASAAARVISAPVMIDNTANLATIGELHSGVLQGVSDGVHIKMSYGVGAGLVVNGQLVRGSAGTAGEIGHLSIDDKGAICRCGNRGCLERYLSLHAAYEACAAGDLSITSPQALGRAYRAGERAVHRWLDDAARHLRIALTMIENLYDPATIVIGGLDNRISCESGYEPVILDNHRRGVRPELRSRT